MKYLITLFTLLYSFNVSAATYEDLQILWDKANFTIKDKKEKEKAFEYLDSLADKIVAKNPNDAEVLAWAGIIKSTKAGVLNNLSSLGLLKEAKTLFEKSIKLNPKALNYSATTSLGSLYYQVPGWPLSFKDEDKAQELLSIALENAPKDIEANYFYAGLLMEQDNFKEAYKYYLRALSSDLRPHREIADEYRRKEIKAILANKFKK